MNFDLSDVYMWKKWWGENGFIFLGWFWVGVGGGVVFVVCWGVGVL